MVTYEEALEIARQTRDDIDYCDEYEEGYVFGAEADADYVGGLGHSPLVVMKKDGKVVDMAFFMFNNPGDVIKEYENDVLLKRG